MGQNISCQELPDVPEPTQGVQTVMDNSTGLKQSGIQLDNQAPVSLSMNFDIFEFEGAWFFFILILTLPNVRLQADLLTWKLCHDLHQYSLPDAPQN